jgi:hypothetical protein
MLVDFMRSWGSWASRSAVSLVLKGEALMELFSGDPGQIIENVGAPGPKGKKGGFGGSEVYELLVGMAGNLEVGH